MSFLSASWLTTALIGLGALTLPVIIHYLFRSRFRVVDWAAMEFLRKSLEEATRKIKFRELLLLLLRMALLGLLAFSLMRPSAQQTKGSADTPVDAVFIMDVSGSMAVRDGEQTRLQAVKTAALQVLSTLPGQSTIHIVQTGLHPQDLGPASPTNRDQARFIIESMEQSHESAHLVRSLELASELLTRSSFANKEVYLFSDMQRSEWNTGSDLTTAWATLQQQGQVILVQSPQVAQPTNATLLQLRAETAMPLPGDRVPFFLEVRNAGATPLQGLTVTLYAGEGDRDAEVQTVPPLKPGETTSLTMTTRLDQRGVNIVTAELQGDEFLLDNRLQSVVETREKLRILIVDGQLNAADPAKSASFFLGHVLKSLRAQADKSQPSPVEIEVKALSDVVPADLANMDVCFLVGIGVAGKITPEVVNRLGTFVQQGGGLILFASSDIAQAGLEPLAKMLPANKAVAFSVDPTSPRRFDGNSIPTGSFLSPFRHPPLDRLMQAETTVGYTWSEVQPDALVGLRFDEGSPALVSRTEGLGTIILVGIRADLQGTDVPLRPGFVPWVQSMVGQVISQQSGKKNILAGETYTWSPNLDQAKQRFVLVPPTGLIRRPLGVPAARDNRLSLSTTLTQQAGVYRIVPESAQAEETGQEGSQTDTFAVAPQPGETASLTTLNEEELKEKFGTAPVMLKTTVLDAGSALRSRIQHEWTGNLWWILLVICLGELAFSWWCNREV